MHIRITDFGTAKIIEEGGEGMCILSLLHLYHAFVVCVYVAVGMVDHVSVITVPSVMGNPQP